MQINAATFHNSLHLEDEKLESTNLECPFCGSRDRQTVYVLQDSPEVLLLKCAICRAASASRMPTNKALAEYYSGHYYYESPLSVASGERITFDDSSRFGKYLANELMRYQSSAHISILDFGGGDGSISHSVAGHLLNRGANKVHISVVDYNTQTLSPRDRRISINRYDTLENVGSQYEFIIASAIIEHLPRPRKALDDLLSCLREGGVFYARTPYIVPLLKAFSLVGLRLDFTYPAHLHDLGKNFWESYFDHITPIGKLCLLESKPSIVQTTLDNTLGRLWRPILGRLLGICWGGHTNWWADGKFLLEEIEAKTAKPNDK